MKCPFCKGMCKCFVEALPAEPWHSYIEGIVVCLAGGKHKNIPSCNRSSKGLWKSLQSNVA